VKSGDTRSMRPTPAQNTTHMTGNVSKLMSSGIAKIHEENNP